ncbi:bile acid:sodium symporter family protein [Pseudonocardia sp. H11422]|uniref:bile acid:sodium symporter family protein n=1 Tax=Pseudonocardia sp. H11422 TaxID=2835866 RepID=UPI0027E25F9B|nr:bile acid:sodium symporter family protein [Pseudonocardia sp. H11422]
MPTGGASGSNRGVLTVESLLTAVLLPVALGVVMLGLGLTLTVADFTRVLAHPRAVLIALACQVVVLPVICLGLVTAFSLAPALAAGMMLLAASPGGTTANLFSHLAGGDVALNVSLTAINSVLSVATLPIVVNLSLAHFAGPSAGIGLQLDKILQVFAIVLVPVALGMLIRRLAPAFAGRMRRPVKIASVLVLVLVIAAAVLENREIVLDGLVFVGPLTLLFAVISLTVGYMVPRFARVNRQQAIACSMEIGIHNSVLAITIALSPALLADAEMAIPPAIYGLVMFLPAGVFAAVLARRARSGVAASPAG